jgi:hypothetical protein
MFKNKTAIRYFYVSYFRMSKNLIGLKISYEIQPNAKIQKKVIQKSRFFTDFDKNLPFFSLKFCCVFDFYVFNLFKSFIFSDL